MKKPALWIQEPMIQVADKSKPPLLSPTVDPSFYHAIGGLVAQWAVMEQQLNILIWALMTHNGVTDPGWRQRGFDKRYDILRDQWHTLAKGRPALAAFLDSAHKCVRVGKVLRDSISHKEIILGMMEDGNHFIQFYNQSRAKQKSKAYYAADFVTAAANAQQAAGWFYWICDPESLWPLPSPDTLLLRTLPNTDHLRLPT